MGGEGGGDDNDSGGNGSGGDGGFSMRFGGGFYEYSILMYSDVF